MSQLRIITKAELVAATPLLNDVPQAWRGSTFLTYPEERRYKHCMLGWLYVLCGVMPPQTVNLWPTPEDGVDWSIEPEARAYVNELFDRWTIPWAHGRPIG